MQQQQTYATQETIKEGVWGGERSFPQGGGRRENLSSPPFLCIYII